MLFITKMAMVLLPPSWFAVCLQCEEVIPNFYARANRPVALLNRRVQPRQVYLNQMCNRGQVLEFAGYSCEPGVDHRGWKSSQEFFYVGFWFRRLSADNLRPRYTVTWIEFVDAPAISSGFHMQPIATPRPQTPSIPARKTISKCTPNGKVWAHRLSDIRRDTWVRAGEFWSPSKVQAAKENGTYAPTWLFRPEQPYDEPEPVKLRVWPVLTVADGVRCNDELWDLNGEIVQESLEADAICDQQEQEANAATEVQIDQGIPKLEQRIAKELLPEILTVTSPDWHSETGVEKVVKYHRVYPIPPPVHTLDAAAPPTSARLQLTSAPCIGEGSHGRVYNAHLTLDERFRLVTDQDAAHPATVRVAVKISSNCDDDLAMLENEARIHAAFPDHLSEDWSGYNAFASAVSAYTDGRVPATAVVPKFYGYFVPTKQTMTKTGFARPILLMEECGTPIEPEDLTIEGRHICFTFLHRLHSEGFLQKSFYARNILVQPGPLTNPPDQRSLETPSFRLVDFGRARRVDDLTSDAVRKIKEKCTYAARPSEVEAAKKRVAEEWKASFRQELETAMDTIFGKLREVSFDVGFDKDGVHFPIDKHSEGKLLPPLFKRACKIREREWIFNLARL
ncbi:hypothetical protein DFH06DRAFT_1304513 [Mycena polygramma]|nr:hypothetical protein DFH06DRAFT_1304513 [Mycena polygramma]